MGLRVFSILPNKSSAMDMGFLGWRLKEPLSGQKENEHLVVHHESQNHLKKTIDWVKIGVLRSIATPQRPYYSQGYFQGSFSLEWWGNQELFKADRSKIGRTLFPFGTVPELNNH